MTSALLVFITGVLLVLTFVLGIIYWNRYPSPASDTTRARTVAVRSCITSCCREQNYSAVAKHIQAGKSVQKQCHKKMGFANFGDDLFTFRKTSEAESCQRILQSGINDESCRNSYYNITRRSIECAQKSKCTSELSTCLHHICAAGVIEYYEDLGGRKKRIRDGHDIISEILRVPGSRDLLVSIMTKGNISTSVSTQTFLENAMNKSYEQQRGGFPETLDFPMRSLLVASWIACGMSASAAIPFFDDIGPLVESVRRWSPASASFHPDVPCDRLVVATFASSHDRGLDVLIESAGLVNIRINVLGYGDVQAGKASKLSGMLEFVRTLHKDTVALFLDGFDTMLVKDEEHILSAYHSFQKDVIFAAEGGCYPYLYAQYNLGVDLCDILYVIPGVKILRRDYGFLTAAPTLVEPMPSLHFLAI